MLTVTVIAKFVYGENDDKTSRWLEKVIVACIPNGLLQETYNPSPEDTIWLAGRNAPSRGEEFRVRLNYSKLAEKAPWRVANVDIPDTGSVSGEET